MRRFKKGTLPRQEKPDVKPSRHTTDKLRRKRCVQSARGRRLPAYESATQREQANALHWKCCSETEDKRKARN
eukprot:6190533-Pleurochrysis_carterae.AAC.4